MLPDAHADDPFPPGARLGDYEVVERLSRGYFSYNLVVRSPTGDLYHAVVHWRDEAKPDVTRRGLQFEMALSHPGLARIVYIGEPCPASGDHVWFVRELLPRPLAGVVFRTQEVLSARQVLEVGRGVCELLEYLHDPARRPQGPQPGRVLVHGFLVPGYIHRTEDGRVKVAGMDVQILADSGVPIPLRHRAYRAPKSVGSPRGDLDPANDLWALAGCMLYLAARLPPTSGHAAIEADERRRDPDSGAGPPGPEYEAELLARLGADHAAEEPRARVRAHVSNPQLQEILLTAFARDPAERFATAAQMRQAIERALRALRSFAPGDRLGPFAVEAVRRYGVYSDTLDLAGEERRPLQGVVHVAAHGPAERDVVLAHLRFLRSLAHPHLAGVVHVGEPTEESHGRVWFARERLETSPEDDALAGRGQPHDAVLRIGRALCDALGHLHGRTHPVTGRPAVHGFLLPGYVYLADDGAVRLTGTDVLGLALAGHGAQDFHGPYRAPECLRAPPAELTVANDLWAVSAVMYRFATAGVATGGAAPIEVDFAHRHDIPRRRAGLLPAGPLRDILHRAFAPHPRDRFRTAAEMGAAIRQGLETFRPETLDSATLRHAIENTFPHPVACAFHQLRATADPVAEAHQLAHVLHVTLQHLATLALASYLAARARDPVLDRWLADRLGAPLSSGDWLATLRKVLEAAGRLGHDPFVPELGERFFHRKGESRASTLAAQADALVELRNALSHRATGAAPTPAVLEDFKRGVLTFLRSVAFLRHYPMISLQGSRIQNGIRTYGCRWHAGFDETFHTVALQCDLGLEETWVAVPHLRSGEVLYLHPFYAVQRCPDRSCGTAHLFRFNSADRRGVEYLSNEGHPLRDEKAGSDLARLLEDRYCRPWRQRAAYLSLGAAEPDTVLSPGIRVGDRYEVAEHLRRGGMADVYRARVAATGEPVALKLLPFRFVGNREVMERFHLEALRRFEHPNVTRILDYGDDLKHHYLVMELATGWRVDGRAALDVCDLPKPRPPAEALSIARQACEGLHCIHAQGTIHRDVKPSNLLLFDEGRVVKLTDFGIARWREAATLTQTGLSLGTPEYMAPEQVDGRDEPTPASDLYSLGVVLYELLTGHSPFRRRTPIASAYAQVHDFAPDVGDVKGDIPHALGGVVRRCLEKNPADRYQTAWDLYQALVAIEQSLPPSQPGTG